MKNPFKKKKADPKEWRNEWVQEDWNTLTLVRYILYADPDLTTVPGAYYQAGADTDYAAIEQAVRQQLEQIEVSTDCAAIFDQAVRLKTLQLQNKLISQRLLHYREAVRVRADAELHVHQTEQRLQDLKKAYAALEEERNRLLDA